jgi:DNA-binding NtrC family response regulator
MAQTLPVNTLISGEIGVGKKLLAGIILPNANAFIALKLEELLTNNNIDLNQYDSLLLYDIHNVLNLEEFLLNLEGKKLIATTLENMPRLSPFFAIKIDIPVLNKRPEDLEELKKIYLAQACEIYEVYCDINDIDIDLSKNTISLKQSIYKSVLLKSLSQTDIAELLENHFYSKLIEKSTYKELLATFEIPLLKAAKRAFKSQLNMSNHLDINRITLRKKLFHYFGA